MQLNLGRPYSTLTCSAVEFVLYLEGWEIFVMSCLKKTDGSMTPAELQTTSPPPPLPALPPQFLSPQSKTTGGEGFVAKEINISGMTPQERVEARQESRLLQVSTQPGILVIWNIRVYD